MAEIETINVLKVDGTQAITTLRELKAEIERDKDALVALGLVEEQDTKKRAEQDKIIKKLQEDQKLLNQVMAAGKTTTLEAAKAIDVKNASYYEMQKALTTLKKGWKDLSAAEREEAQGQEMLQKIKELDAELKTLDADIGQFQRNVGNYGMSFKQALEQAQQGATGLQQGMMALSSVLMLTNTESEGTKKAMAGMQAAVMMLSSVKGLQGLTEVAKNSTTAQKLMGVATTAATVATKGETTAVGTHATAMAADTAATEAATVATKGFSAALVATGIGAIVVILGELIALLMVLSERWGDVNDDAKDAIDSMAQGLEDLNEKLEDQIEMLKARGAVEEEVLTKEIEGLASLVTAYEEYFDKIFEESGFNKAKAQDAYDEYMEKSDELKDKLLEAKYALEGFVAAAEKKEAQKNMTETEIAIDNVKRRSEQLRNVAGNLYEQGIINAAKYLDYLNRIREAEETEITNITNTHHSGGSWRAARDNARSIAKAAADAFKTEEELLTEKYNTQMKLLEKYHIDTTDLTNKYYADLKALEEKAAEEERKQKEKEAQEKEKEQKEQEKQAAEALAAEEKRHQEEIRAAREAAKEKMAETDKETDWAIRRNNLVRQTERERAANEYDITKEGNEKKLEALRQFAIEAEALGDQEGALEYQQQAADLSVEIELQALEERERIRKMEKDSRIEAAKQSVEAVSNIMEALADMYESDTENTEKNAKKAKNLRIAAATIDMFQGAVTAYTSAQSLGPTLGPIVGGINAAAVIAMGLANIAKMRSTEVSADSSAGSTSADASVTAPQVPSEVAQVRSVTGASEEDRLNRMAGGQRVYILSSDLEANRASTRATVKETTF